MILYGEYSPGEARLFRKVLLKGDVVIEGGANQGFLTLPIADCVGPTGKVLAFEPQPQFCDILRSNVRKMPQVEVYQKALADVRGQTAVQSIEQVDAQGIHRSYGAMALGQGEYEVEQITIDSLYLTRLNFIKADVEGFEVPLIEGARNTIMACRPILYLENDKPKQCLQLIDKVKSLEYSCFWHLPFFYYSDNYRGNARNFFGATQSWNMLCIPRECDDIIADVPSFIGI